ncbi:hypothetical protein V8E36_003542 [Tilletia maclaganii]
MDMQDSRLHLHAHRAVQTSTARHSIAPSPSSRATSSWHVPPRDLHSRTTAARAPPRGHHRSRAQGVHLFPPCHKSHIDYRTISWLICRLGIALPKDTQLSRGGN